MTTTMPDPNTILESSGKRLADATPEEIEAEIHYQRQEGLRLKQEAETLNRVQRHQRAERKGIRLVNP